MQIKKFNQLFEQGSGDVPACSCGKKKRKKGKMKWNLTEHCGHCSVCGGMKPKKKKKKKLNEKKKNKKDKCCKGVEYGIFKGEKYTGKIIGHNPKDNIMYI
jgi:hypothetical protein